MRPIAIALLLSLLVAGSAPGQPRGEPLQAELQRARAEQAGAEAQTLKLERIASRARGEAERLRAQQAAAAQAIQAAEARITAADTEARLAAAYVTAYRERLTREQKPISSLLAGLAVMAQRPPLLALTDRSGTDELVKVRILLRATLPVIRRRTLRLSAQLSEGERLQQAALAARAELRRSEQGLVAKRQQFAALEQKALQQALASSGEALSAGDLALAAGENVERLNAEQANNRSVRMIAQQLASEGAAPARPLRAEGRAPTPPFSYVLPAAAPVTEGLAAVNRSGVRSRGLTLATARGAPVTAPADGVVRFAGAFRDYDGVMIIDHGDGWMSLIVNLGSPLRTGAKVRLGQPLGRALGPLQVELSQNGRRISPALIAGSSPSLSKAVKGG